MIFPFRAHARRIGPRSCSFIAYEIVGDAVASDENGIAENRKVRTAEVAGVRQTEGAGVLAECQCHRGGTKDMAGVLEPAVDSFLNAEWRGVRFAPQKRQRGIHVLLRVQRRDGREPLPAVSFVDKLRILLLYMGAVPEHHLAQALRRAGAKNRSPEPLMHECRKIPAVVDMGVGKHDSGNIRRVKRKPAVPLA